MIVLMKRKKDLLKAMSTFIVVIDRGSFSAASRELNIVTSAISRQVSDLEEHFTCQLLYRSTRAMSLTAEGKQYLEKF
jgi:DNA-binding transcriptional LysR family regulator